MIPKSAIEKAIEGGWRPNPERTTPVTITETQHWFGQSQNLTLGYAQIALDPLFWQALGKALRWAKQVQSVISWHKNEVPTWQNRAHRFYDLILTGGDTEKFWEEILKST